MLCLTVTLHHIRGLYIAYIVLFALVCFEFLGTKERTYDCVYRATNRKHVDKVASVLSRTHTHHRNRKNLCAISFKKNGAAKNPRHTHTLREKNGCVHFTLTRATIKKHIMEKNVDASREQHFYVYDSQPVEYRYNSCCVRPEDLRTSEKRVLYEWKARRNPTTWCFFCLPYTINISNRLWVYCFSTFLCACSRQCAPTCYLHRVRINAIRFSHKVRE